MILTVLGSGSAFSAPHRYNSCCLLEAGETKIMIDCGSDALRAVQKAGVDLSQIQAIFITHMHADHCGGLPAVVTAMHVADRDAPIEVFVPHTHMEFVRTWFAHLFLYSERLAFPMAVRAIYPGKVKLENGTDLEFIENSHLQKYHQFSGPIGIGTASFSLVARNGGANFFYSGDIDHVEDVRSYLDDTLSLVEATHPSLDELAALANEGKESVYFTHIPQELEDGGEWKRELEHRFGITNLNVVHDGQVLVV